ncbi:MAG: tetratricopeptide repeat protein [Gammaproteobacteria bacterium]|nr:MAG: tetratricopeptide repeat protein [Gammaproteobacteria bacterium]
MSDLFTELKRRNVFRVVLLYVIASWLILQVGDILMPALGVPDWGIKLVLGLLVLGFPLAVIFSWVFEMTPEGLKREKDIDRTQSITGETGGKINILIVGLLVVAVGLLAFNTFRAPEPMEIAKQGAEAVVDAPPVRAAAASPEAVRVVLPVDKSIAVLPFVNMSGDKENEYFSDGLAETLLHMLSQVKDLRVAARTSSFQFKNRTGDIDEIGKQLHVATILEGSVRKSQNTVRITAQLINVADGYHMWSGTYDRELDDVFAIQDEIAMKVVEALKVELLGAQAGRLTLGQTENIDAYEAFLQGRKAQNEMTFEALDLAEIFFERALEIDSNYAMAHVALAENYLQKSNTGSTDLELVENEVESNARRALELDPDLGEAYASLGALKSYFGEVDEAQVLFNRALELSPSYANTYLWAGRSHRFEGQLSEAEELIRQGLRIDPLASHMQWELARILQWQWRFDESIDAYERAVVIAPDDPNGYAGIGMAYRSIGEFPEAIRYNKLAGQRDPDDYEYASDLSILYAVLEDFERAGAWLEVAQQLGSGETMPIAAEAIFKYLSGKRDEAARISREFLVSGQGNRHYAAFLMRQILANVDLQSFPETILTQKRVRGDEGSLLNEMPEPEHDAFLVDVHRALLLAMAYREAGEEKKAEHLISTSLEIVDAVPEDEQTMPGYFSGAAMAFALGGRTEDFRKLMESAMDRPGAFRLAGQIFWRDGPQFDSVRDLPEFQAILAALEETREPMRMAAANASD